MLDSLGRVREATALEERITAVVHAAGEPEPSTFLWTHIGLGIRASVAHEDPWRALAHSDAVQAIYAVTGGEQFYLAMQLWRGLALWYIGALAQARQILAEITAIDSKMGVGGAWRRLGLAWIRADRGALDDARAIATELAEFGHAQRNPLEEGRGCWALGEVLRRLAAAEDALARWRAMGGCGIFRGAFVHLVLAEAEAATGALDAALRTITEARARLLDIGARIADPALQRSFLEDVPENARIPMLAHAWIGEHS